MQPEKKQKRPLEVSVPRLGQHTPGGPNPHGPPQLRRLTTPDCMSSPVSHLRDLTRDLEDGAKRRRAAQYLRETREEHLQQRRLYLVLDLDETLVHSLRASVRQVGSGGGGHGRRGGAAAAAAGGGGAGGDGSNGKQATVSGGGGATPSARDADSQRDERAAAAAAATAAPAIGPMPVATGARPHRMRSNSSYGSVSEELARLDSAADATDEAAAGASGAASAEPDVGVHGDPEEVTLQVQNVEFEMKLRPGVHQFLREMAQLFCVHLYTMGSREYVQQVRPRPPSAHAPRPPARAPARQRAAWCERPRQCTPPHPPASPPPPPPMPC